MKKTKNAAKNKMNPDPSAIEGVSAQSPYEDFAKKDAEFKKRRGGTQR